MSSYARVKSVDVDGLLRTVAGSPAVCSEGGDGTPAAQACFSATAFAIGPDGLLYLADYHYSLHVAAPPVSRILRITPEGLIQVVAGNGTDGSSGDGGPATLAQVTFTNSLAFGPDGSLYMLDVPMRIRRVDPSGTITTIGGGGNTFDDNVPATWAALSAREIAVAPDGAIYITDTYTHRVRMILPDGVIRTIAGGRRRRAVTAVRHSRQGS
jgi:serine/threonine-protein kinase